MERISLNAVTLNLKSQEKMLEVASDCGFNVVGLHNSKGVEQYLGEGHTLSDLRGLLDKYNLQVSEYMAVRKWQRAGNSNLREAMEEVHEVCNIAKAIDCKVVTTPVSGRRESIDEWIETFSKVCDVAEEYDVTIAFEFIAGGKQVKDIDMAWDIINGVDHPNGGLLVDTFHFYKGNSNIETLKSIPSEKIALIHITDAVDKPKEDLKDNDRLLPGDGVIDIAEIVKAANEGSSGPYNGYYSVEIFNDEYWNSDPNLIARLVMEKTKKVLDQVI